VLRAGNLESRRDVTDVRDTVRAYVSIVQRGRPARPYNVCSGAAYRVRDLLEALVGLSRVPITIEVDPARLRPSDNPVIAGDRSRITSETGWVPGIPIEQDAERSAGLLARRDRSGVVMRTSAFSEDGRQLAHIAMGLVALLLRWITGTEAMVIVAVALVFNVWALPHIASSLFRPMGGSRHADPGIVFYPAAVLLLLMLFPDRIDIVAGAVGHHGRRRRYGVHRGAPHSQSTGAMESHAHAGGQRRVRAVRRRRRCVPLLVVRVSRRASPYPWFSTWMPFLAALAAAAAETLPIRLDDNISVPATAAAVLWSTSLVNDELVIETVFHSAAILPIALSANGVIAAAGYFAGTVTISGALCGAAIGTVIIATAGWGGWGLLLATFALAALASRMGLRHKTVLGIAEPRGGRRGAANAFANTGVAAAAAMLSAMTYATDAAMVAFAAALVAGGSDTVSSEIGKAWGRRTFLVTTLGRVAPGTSGAMSLEGTAAGIVAAFALAAIGVALGVVSSTALMAVVIAATTGSLVESVLAATFEREGILDNDLLNLINTATAALCAVWLVTTFG
jgi:uncharacterized protein (TIGR00297 family)